MLVRSLALASLLVLGGTAAYAESESNNPAATEVMAGTGVYYSNQQQSPRVTVTADRTDPAAHR